MEGLRHDPDPAHDALLVEARRVLALPVEETRMHWHPFGVYAIPLARRREGMRTWSRRLHIWHPEAEPVGEASPYGVHTHTGTARSHVLLGRLEHHLYDFAADPDGAWQKAELGDPRGRARLVAHVRGMTEAGMVHTLPSHRPHGVSRPGWAVSLFEQQDALMGERPTTQFTTWRRTDQPEVPLVMRPPVPVAQVAAEALFRVEDALARLEADRAMPA